MIMTIDESPILEQIDDSIEKLLKSEEAEMKSLGARLLQNAMTDDPEGFDFLLRKYIYYPFRFEYRPGISTNDLMVKVIDIRSEVHSSSGTSGYYGYTGVSGTPGTSGTPGISGITGYSTTYVGNFNTIPVSYTVGYNSSFTGMQSQSHYTIGSDEDVPIKQKKTFLQWLRTKIWKRQKGLNSS